MKRLIPFLVLLVGASGALSQTVSFRNNDQFSTIAERRVFADQVGGTPLVGVNNIAQLMYGTSATSLTPHTGTVTFRNVATSDALAGTWIGGTRTLTGLTPGQTITLQVRAWDNTTGATYDSALRRGISTTFTYMIPATSPPPPASAFFMEGLRGFALVPEPSVIGLGLLGVGALFLLRRRK
jgi:hypothetical protein